MEVLVGFKIKKPKSKMKKFLTFAVFIIAAIAGFADPTGGSSVLIVAAGPQAVTADYFNNIVTTFDLNITKWLPKLYRRYGNQGADIIDLLMSLGFERTDAVTAIRHFEENWIHQAFQVKVGTAGANGAAKNITLAANSLDAQNRFYPRVNDVVTFSNETTALILSIDVTTPTAPVLSVAPFDVSKPIPATLEGEVIIITGNAWSEGSTQPSGRFSGAWQYVNYTQIVKESIGASGTQMTNETWVKFMDGKNIDGWFNKGLLDIDHRQKINMQGMFLTQEKNTNPLVVDSLNNNGSIQTTEGLFPYMKRVAIPYPYTPGTLNVQDFNALERLMSRQYSPRTVCAMMGQDVDLELEDVMKEYHAFTNIEFATKVANEKLFGNEPEKQALASIIAFQYFTKGQRTYALKRFEAMNDPQTYGADGYNYPGKAIFFPLERRIDPKSKNSIPAIGVVFKAMGENSRKAEVWNYGAAGGGPKMGAQDRRDWYMRSEVSTEFFGGNQFVDMFVQ